MIGCSDWYLNDSEELITLKPKDSVNQLKLIALLRVRNEELILQDTLDHLSEFADLICVYDDNSNDETFSILKRHPQVGFIIRNNTWLDLQEQRLISETRHRGLLLDYARKFYSFSWCMCCDADERYVGDIRDFVEQNPDLQPDAVRIRLFDAYMTYGDDASFVKGQRLLNFRKFFGHEYRDILMLWKNTSSIKFQGIDAREPYFTGDATTKFYCQHYGKSLSYDHWDETCNYYATYFPWETYGRKWSGRKGKALHYDKSDFGGDLYPWGEELFLNAKKLG